MAGDVAVELGKGGGEYPCITQLRRHRADGVVVRSLGQRRVGLGVDGRRLQLLQFGPCLRDLLIERHAVAFQRGEVGGGAECLDCALQRGDLGREIACGAFRLHQRGEFRLAVTLARDGHLEFRTGGVARVGRCRE